MLPVYARWAAAEWAVAGRTQGSIAKQLGVGVQSVCMAIGGFVAEALTLSSREISDRHLYDIERKAVVRQILSEPIARAQYARILDPDEATANRDVWLTFVPHHGKSLDR